MKNGTTKNYIIEQANKLFLEKGYQAVTVMDICNACGISKTTFYYHLHSKEEIILGFYGSTVHNVSQHLMLILAKDNYWDQFIFVFELLVEEAYKYGTDFFSQMLIMNLKEDYGSFDFKEELTNLAIVIIKKAQECGQIRNRNHAEDLYKAAGYAALGYEMTWCIKKGELDWKKEMRESFEVLFDVAPEFRVTI